MLSPSAVDGVERLELEVTWVNQNRDRIVIVHKPVGANSRVVVSGRSANDVMRTIANFFDYVLETTDDSFVFKFK